MARCSTNLLLATLVLALTLLPGRPSAAQQRAPEVHWNNPDGPKHPDIQHSSFHSPSMDVEVGFNVYTPPGYDQGNTRYPVIYFLHGAGGNENSDAGGFSDLVATYVKAKKTPRAICVFPNGANSGYSDHPERKVLGETLVINELIPLIDRTYRTRTDRDSRVICGFSMGGGGAVRLALKHPDLFSAAGSWAGAIAPPTGPVVPELSVGHLSDIAGRVRLLLIVGDQDITLPKHQLLLQNLEEAKYPVRYEVLKGVSHKLDVYRQQTGEEMVLFLVSGFAPEE